MALKLWRRRAVEPSSAPGAAVRGSLLGAGVLLVLALVLIVNYLGWKYHARFDWTAGGSHTLSETTENVLAELDRDVRVVVFVAPESPLYEPTRDLLESYEAASPRLAVEWLDAEANPVEAQRLVEELEVGEQSVVFEAGEERRVVAAEELADVDFAPAQLGEPPAITAFRGEERFTSALVSLTQGERPRVAFTTGHGEISLDDRSATGLSLAQELLGPDPVDIEEWASLGAEGVPEGIDLVVVAGPRAAFTAAELAALDRFLAGGGRLLALLDPVFRPGGAGEGFADLGLTAWLAGYGVELGDDVVVDPSAVPAGFSAETFYATRYGEHPITRSLDVGIPVLLRQARSVGAAAIAPAGIRVTELIETDPEGWAISRFGAEPVAGPAEGDRRGPVPLAVAVETTAGAGEGEEASSDLPTEEGAAAEEGSASPSPARLAIVGDADFAINGLLQVGPGNPTLLNNLFNWLLEREVLLGIPPKPPDQVRLAMTPSELRWANLVVLVILPGLAIAAGIWVWLRRRRVR